MSKISRRSLLKMAAGLTVSGVFAWTPDEVKADAWEIDDERVTLLEKADEWEIVDQSFAHYFIEGLSTRDSDVPYFLGWKAND